VFSTRRPTGDGLLQSYLFRLYYQSQVILERHNTAHACARLIDDITASISDRNELALSIRLHLGFASRTNTKANHCWPDTDILLLHLGLYTETAQSILNSLCQRG